MGQNLFAPPNVKGWPGGEAWINSNTLLARKQFLDRLARMDDAPPAMMTAMTADAAPPAPRAAVASPQGAADEDKVRAQRFAQAMDRGVRNVRFDAAVWVARQAGDTPAAKMQAAQTLLLPLTPVTAEAPDSASDALAFVRSTLLDPAYQLK